jgi:hypothetical protein
MLGAARADDEELGLWNRNLIVERNPARVIPQAV